jgi:hypothetical protein
MVLQCSRNMSITRALVNTDMGHRFELQ